MKRFGTKTVLVWLALVICQCALAVVSRADVLLQGFYWDVPSPQAGQANAPWWWNHLAAQAHDLQKAGFTYIWLPPVVKGANAQHSVGYDPFDDYDIGGKDQHGFASSRYGTREQLERCVAMLRANGLNVLVDLVENHRDGDLNLFLNYKDAYGNPTGGRFAKTPDDFHHDGVPQDPDVPEETGNQMGMFGPDLAPVNGKNHHAFDGLIDAGDWLTHALDVQGYRLDYVKGISTDWLLPFLNSKAMKGKWAVGEFYDGDLGKVSHWVHDSMQNRASAFDFPLRDLLKQMCDQNGGFDMRRLDHAGLAGNDPFRAVTFVENHDTDHDNNNHIVQGKMLAYAYILTSEGLPSVFYRDYSMDAGSYHLKPQLDKLILIHETLASGTTQQRWKDGDIFAYERLGGPHLLTALNDSPNNPRTITVDTGFGPNKTLHDYAGHVPDIQTDGQGKVTLTVPANSEGGGYVCCAPAGRTLRLPARAFSVTQDYEGAPDLDIKPADNAQFVPVCRVWAAKGKRIRAALTCDTTAWTPQTRVTVQMQGPADATPLVHVYSAATNGTAWNRIAKQTGWHTFTIRAADTPDANLKPAYRLRLTYAAPQTLE